MGAGAICMSKGYIRIFPHKTRIRVWLQPYRQTCATDRAFRRCREICFCVTQRFKRRDKCLPFAKGFRPRGSDSRIPCAIVERQ